MIKVAWVSVADRLPDSGVPVLVYVVDPQRPKWTRRLRAQYATKHTLEQAWSEDSGDYDEASDTYYVPEGWYETNEFEDTHWHIDGEVTHWMPLPEPPTKYRERVL